MSETKDRPLQALLNAEHPERILERARPFMEFMMRNKCALREIETKLNVLNDEFSTRYNRNPIESIKTRLKSPLSIVQKMQRRGFEMTLENIESKLNDIAGIRVICSFPEDIYHLADMLCRQDDITVVAIKDYIKHPKPNGYRSLHLILDVPIFLSTEKRHMRAEVQFRTIAMDFWASLEHQLTYKRENIPDADLVAEELRECADIISEMDGRMQHIRKKIDLEKAPSAAQDIRE